jgi:uncharacterized protein involved in exopolysaccharide biosynthesis
MQTHELDLSEYGSSVRRARPAIFAIGVVFAVIAVGLTAYMKPMYQAEASLLMATQSQSVNPLSSFLGKADANPLNVLKGIIKSRTALERIAEQTQVDVKDLEKAIGVTTNADENQMVISVAWKTDKEKAKEIASATIQTLESMNQEIGFSVASRQSQLLEKQIAEKQKELEAAEKSVKDFQKIMKAPVDPTSPASLAELMKQRKQLEGDLEALKIQISEAKKQAQRVAGSSADLPTGLPNAEEWRGRVVKAEYDLRIAEVKLGPEAPEVVRLRRELQITRDRLQTEISNYLKSVSSNVDANIVQLEAQRIVLEWRVASVREMAIAAPDEATELQRRLREVAALTTVLSSLRQQYELKKVDEVGDVSWSVLEPPFFPDEEPINKNFVRNGVVGFFLGAFLSIGMTIIRQRGRSARSGA